MELNLCNVGASGAEWLGGGDGVLALVVMTQVPASQMVVAATAIIIVIKAITASPLPRPQPH